MNLKGLALSVLILVITVSIGAKITDTVYDTYDNSSSTAASIADEGTSAMGDFSDWFPIIVITGIGAAILLMLRGFNA